MPRCPRCPAVWTGVESICHCGGAGGCHRTFSGLAHFDRHRNHDGSHGACLDPASVGLRFDGTMWRGPDDPQKIARLRRRSRR